MRSKLAYLLIFLALCITVLGATSSHWLAIDAKLTANSIRAACSNITGAIEARDCYSDQVSQQMNRGLPFVFQLIDTLFAMDTRFSYGCHYLMHPIGKAAFEAYQDSPDSDFLVPDASVCNYGFYHGFIGAAMDETNDVMAAKHFCDSIAPEALAQRPDAQNQCYHGLGHGFLEQSIKNQPTTIQDLASVKRTLRAAVEPVVKNCETVATPGPERDNCLSGLFHGIAMLQEAEGWAMDRNNPIWLCGEVAQAYKGYCLGNQHRLVIDTMPKASLQEVARFAEALYGSDPAAMRNIIWRWSYNHTKGLQSTGDIVEQCNQIDPIYQTHCITGALSKLQENGASGQEYRTAAEFCMTDDLTADERTACTESSYKYFTGIYSARQMANICNEYKTLYAFQCSTK